MSSLHRYRRPGGFVQLVSLIETFGPQKRDKFLEMIEAESAPWAAALRVKLLTIDRILTWPDEVAAKIMKDLPLKSQAYFLATLDEGPRARLQGMLSGSERRRLDDIMSENTPKPDELASVVIKYVETARRMLLERELVVERVDAELAIPGDFEARLDEGPAAPMGGADVATLQRQLAGALKENKGLKDEVKALRERLDQIRKIA